MSGICERHILWLYLLLCVYDCVCVCVCVCVMQENVCIFLRVRVHVSEKKCALREKRHWARDIEQRRSMLKSEI